MGGLVERPGDSGLYLRLRVIEREQVDQKSATVLKIKRPQMMLGFWKQI